MALALAPSAWFASIAFRRYVRSYPAALLGGLVYGFSPAMIAQSSSHLHLTLGAVRPPLMLLIDELLVRQRRNPLRSGSALSVLAAGRGVGRVYRLAAGLPVPRPSACRRRHPGDKPQRQRPALVPGPDPDHDRHPAATLKQALYMS